MEGSINKLKIISLPGPETGQSKGVANTASVGTSINPANSSVFEVQINPEQITRNFSIKYHEPSVPGAPGSEFQFEKVNAEELELKFILDGTGAVHQNDKPSMDSMNTLIGMLPAEAQTAYVPLKVLQLQNAVYNFSDENHRTPFVSVQYGKIVFMGLLQNMGVTYNLFSASGIPLRAEITLKLKAHTPFKDASAMLSLMSQDLTRHRVVKAGDNILSICLDAYKDEKYYIEIARVNNLTNFRKLKPFMNIILPSINKTSDK